MRKVELRTGGSMRQRMICALPSMMPLIILASCSLSRPPSASTQNPPLYREAQQVTVQRTEDVDRNVQKILYQSQASSEAIETFYKNELGNDDWEFESDLSAPHQLYFGWIGDRNPNVSAFEMM